MTEEAAVAAIAHDTRSSIELAVDAKRIYRWQIKKYHGDSRDELDAAIEDLRWADERLRNLFGAASGEESLDKLPF